MQEEWRPIEGFEGCYEVSNLGRVRSLDRDIITRKGWIKRIRGRILKPLFHDFGYLMVSLGAKNRKLVHRLVATAFIGKPPTEDAEVNHIDFDPGNPRVDNLEWTTPKGNIQHSHKARHFCPVANPNHRRKLSPDQVRELLCLVRDGHTQASIAKRYGISRSYVSFLKDRKKWVNLDIP